MKNTTLNNNYNLIQIELLTKKFQVMTLEDREKLNEALPHKKFPRSTSITKSPNPFYLLPLATNADIRQSARSQYTTVDLKSSKMHSRKRARAHSLSNHNSKKQRHVRNKHRVEIYAATAVESDESSPSKSASKLGSLFGSCVNFVKTSRLAGSDDIDWMVRNITGHGQVMKIQNHWSPHGPEQKWYGAMVTYITQHTCHQVIKRLYADKFTSLTPVYIPHHLTLIGSLEERLRTTHPGQFDQGSAVVIIGDRKHEMCEQMSTGIKKMADQYGHVMSFVCSAEDSCVKWEVTYQYAVEAVAALLDLDGKFYKKGRLRTVPKWGEKEKKLNVMVTGYY